MNDRTDRRRFLKRVAVTAAGCWTLGLHTRAGGQGPPASSGGDGSPRVTSYAFGSRVWVRVDGRVFTCYRAESKQKYPYFYPVVGPATGLPMTAETAVPYPHHRSLFFGCDHVNGGNYWQDRLARGQIISSGPEVAEGEPDKVVITDRCAWRQPGQDAIIEDERRFTIAAPSRDQRFVDADITLRARVDVHITKTNHSFFSLRAARELAPIGGGVLVNAAGQMGEKATFGQPAPWCGYHGTRLGVTESVVLMDHPENPWSPCPWFTRDYGFISPTPFNWLDKKGWHLAAGESIRVRYRVVVSKGPIEADAMNDVFRIWVTG